MGWRNFRLGVFKRPGQIAVYRMERPVAKYTERKKEREREGEREREKYIKKPGGISAKRHIMRDLKS